MFSNVYAASWADTTGDKAAKISDFEAIFENILKITAEIAIIVLFLALVGAGLKYLTSGGDPKATESAQHSLTNAILGILFFSVIWLLFSFIGQFLGIQNFGVFQIPK
jgi:hypothetical protein